jgi:hypothetical protein
VDNTSTVPERSRSIGWNIRWLHKSLLLLSAFLGADRFWLKRRSATYQGLSFEVDADIRAFVVWSGGFIHWLELEAQWHTRNSTARLGKRDSLRA